MTTLPAHTISVSIERDPVTVSGYVRDPRNLPAWAPGFAKSVREDADDWLVETADGTVRFAFVPDNDLGVVDHRVSVEGEPDAMNPMRVIANVDGSEVLFTLLRPPEATDDEFQRDVGLVADDLQRLKQLLEGADHDQRAR